ncbi:uncharacterized protein Z520_12122 [Fonsecaea multimorphosa CBS 102226]|uniref:BTB domain-containing protein n=1 Tax=Fonsecaea multimorphosa CBS 102226 TaxID=1442371 RepID=A0A0D2JNR0_9EURO|nr:uncharacterized protein Z520_12122 [Fonsecaea multimorphosa CBS 102226]KIX92129.1 hypothetical protein Z520_12122 [Fonsecaea multimorphosa CBS 102226]OAL17555.1 hypothetical protein AYO22_11534 [Fonsecaea multimorphosa]
MADREDQAAESGEADVEMGTMEEVQEGEDEKVEGEEAGNDTLVANGNTSSNPQTMFLEYLKSPIVQLIVGAGDDETTLTAHKAILSKSPYFSEILSALDDDALVVELPDESLDAVGCFLQYQYTGEYFPRRLADSPDGLEPDPSVPAIDSTGAQLLKHARVYTLAQKLGLPDLKTLAHSKIHRINSTAVGEIAYARFVYGNTPADDVTIRKPVAAFWATRSHVLRHEAEDEFKAMCLEYPQFGFDVLSLVLDQREKRAREREEEGTPGGTKGRKRMRPSVNI